jgi:hypothetical protein
MTMVVEVTGAMAVAVVAMVRKLGPVLSKTSR